MLEPDMVVLDTDIDGESGWLTCAKLKQDRPAGEVILVTGEECLGNDGLAEFLGAVALVSRQHNLVSLLQSRRSSFVARPLAEAA